MVSRANESSEMIAEVRFIVFHGLLQALLVRFFISVCCLLLYAICTTDDVKFCCSFPYRTSLLVAQESGSELSILALWNVP